MERKIKVFRLGKYREQIEEVGLHEAEKIVADASPMCLIIDRKTHEIITEIGPDVEEIAIKPIILDGG
jgi:hypothetical protein